MQQSDGLIYQLLKNANKVTATESSHYKSCSVSNLLDSSSSYWDSSSSVIPSWFNITFSIPVLIKYYSIKSASYGSFLRTWSVFDSRGKLIDKKENDATFNSLNQYASFKLKKSIKTTSIKLIIYDETWGSGVAYINSFDVYGEICTKESLCLSSARTRCSCKKSLMNSLFLYSLFASS